MLSSICKIFYLDNRDAHSNIFRLFFDCFSVRFSTVFTANSKIFAVKTDEKQNEKQMKNGYCELPPPGILEKQRKKQFFK